MRELWTWVYNIRPLTEIDVSQKILNNRKNISFEDLQNIYRSIIRKGYLYIEELAKFGWSLDSA